METEKQDIGREQTEELSRLYILLIAQHDVACLTLRRMLQGGLEPKSIPEFGWLALSNN